MTRSRNRCRQRGDPFLFSVDSCNSTPGGWPRTKIGVRRRMVAAVVPVHFPCNSMGKRRKTPVGIRRTTGRMPGAGRREQVLTGSLRPDCTFLALELPVREGRSGGARTRGDPKIEPPQSPGSVARTSCSRVAAGLASSMKPTGRCPMPDSGPSLSPIMRMSVAARRLLQLIFDLAEVE